MAFAIKNKLEDTAEAETTCGLETLELPTEYVDGAIDIEIIDPNCRIIYFKRCGGVRVPCSVVIIPLKGCQHAIDLLNRRLREAEGRGSHGGH